MTFFAFPRCDRLVLGLLGAIVLTAMGRADDESMKDVPKPSGIVSIRLLPSSSPSKPTEPASGKSEGDESVSDEPPSTVSNELHGDDDTSKETESKPVAKEDLSSESVFPELAPAELTLDAPVARTAAKAPNSPNATGEGVTIKVQTKSLGKKELESAKDPLSLSPSEELKLADSSADISAQGQAKVKAIETSLLNRVAVPDAGKLKKVPHDSAADSASDHSGSDQDTAECPGAPGDEVPTQKSQPGDVPLEQADHPYDAPNASQASISDPKSVVVQDLSFTARELAIQRGINKCLDYFLMHPENVVRRGPWALMHATLPLGVETEIIAGNRRVNAIGWMCFNGVCAKQRMFQSTRTGFRTNLGPGVQGHEGQFLAILAQSRVRSEYPLQIGRRRYTINDLVKYEMATCREKSELTFKLIGLSHYLPPNQRWRDNRGRIWNLEKMVAEELAQPVNGAACGGSHRLMGLSYAIVKRQQKGEALTGHFKRAEEYINDYVRFAMSLQNPDGSFSTEWFESRGAARDVERKVQTSGHILEWLVYTLPDEHLRSPRIQDGVEFLLQAVGGNPSHDWPIGPRGHALRTLALYNQRVFGVEPGKLKENIANMKTQARYR